MVFRFLHSQTQRMHFEKGETLRICFVVLGFLHSQQRRVQLLLRFEKWEALANFVFMVFRFLHSQKRREQLLVRFEKGKTLAFFVHGFPLSTTKRNGCTF